MEAYMNSTAALAAAGTKIEQSHNTIQKARTAMADSLRRAMDTLEKNTGTSVEELLASSATAAESGFGSVKVSIENNRCVIRTSIYHTGSSAGDCGVPTNVDSLSPEQFALAAQCFEKIAEKKAQLALRYGSAKDACEKSCGQ